jgi:hypothetical protein
LVLPYGTLLLFSRLLYNKGRGRKRENLMNWKKRLGLFLLELGASLLRKKFGKNEAPSKQA